MSTAPTTTSPIHSLSLWERAGVRAEVPYSLSPWERAGVRAAPPTAAPKAATTKPSWCHSSPTPTAKATARPIAAQRKALYFQGV